ncbi:MAG: V-type ATP synthase subunit D [Hadesarchaea archaeon CG08_land_8_20_14_0_20_51_8]|nr:MAG: V-type ATP synthase subunit D [Hadesarchaea archaeon CG08_land_8_20_14_0_20_51_8]
MAKTIGVTPTRMELLKLKQRVSLAQKGHDLLHEKMDALVIEFFGIVKRIREVRAGTMQQLSSAYRALSICFAMQGTIETYQAAREVTKVAEVDISTRHVMGILVPVVEAKPIERHALARGYGIHTTSSTLDDASREFERALGDLIKLAELEEGAREIALELEKTKRRVNALEYVILPNLKSMVKFISMRLDEMERENFSRLKRIKAMLEGRE